MTCASCVNRVERKLGKLDGVEASVNLPLESAHVTVPAGITDQQIMATVNATGYKATAPPVPPRAARTAEADREHAGATSPAARKLTWRPARDTGTRRTQLRPRLILAAVLTVPVFLISMVPALQFPNWGWVAGLWPCRWSAGRPGPSTAPPPSTPATLRPPWTPSSPSASPPRTFFSVWQLVADPRMTEHPGMEGMERPAACTSKSPRWSPPSCCWAGSSKPTPNGRPATPSRPCWTSAPRTPPSCATAPSTRSPPSSSRVGDVVVVRPGEKIATDGVVDRRQLRRRRLPA